ncbi:hypothetical protein [Rossellomorea vietnamensis]|uniref:Uncharacterized protein n=1 Tax=Rossellomorea vietnamensis TaxID=218284 RepID=A0A0N8GHD3_9BACI|nr:hypothetical protein [Rossellomorea vietnamensis]KPL60978.1 hypothetical protein AM506_04425 [Rossellomorea vietnamensis]
MRKISIILGVIILIVILANISDIIAHAKLYGFEQNKSVTTETKVVTFREIFETLYEQREVARELEDSIIYSLIGDEVRKGADEASVYEIFLDQNKQIESLKINLPITKYEDGDKTIEFISGKGEVLEVFEDGQWEEFDGSWDDFVNEYWQNDH